MSRDTVGHVTSQSATPEGQLLRDARTRAGLTQRQAASLAGMSLKQWGESERGITTDSRVPDRKVRVPDRTLALMAGALGITSDDLVAAGRSDAARILEDTSPLPAAEQAVTDGADRDKLTAAEDRLIESLVARVPDAHHREVLEWIWRGLDREGRPKPRADRIDEMYDWLSSHPDALSAVADSSRHVS